MRNARRTPAAPDGVKIRGIAAALSLAALVAATEYFFRHYVMFWMPTLGTLGVNDMVALALAYSLLTVVVGAFSRVDWGAEARGLGQALREFVTQPTWTLWFAGLILGIVVLSRVDQSLWGEARLPMHVSPYRNPAAWFASAATVLNAAAMLAVNGVLVPIAEEYLWRGHIQPRLVQALPVAVAVAVTATLFSLKHVVVDASWGRFLTVVAFGAVCGVVALRHGWRSSAALHLAANLVMTAVSLATSLG